MPENTQLLMNDPAHTTLEHRFGSIFAPTYDLYLTLIVRKNALIWKRF